MCASDDVLVHWDIGQIFLFCDCQCNLSDCQDTVPYRPSRTCRGHPQAKSGYGYWALVLRQLCPASLFAASLLGGMQLEAGRPALTRR